MPSYKVRWEIDIDASTEREAAEQARAIQRDPQSTATIFEVWPTQDIDGDFPAFVTIEVNTHDPLPDDLGHFLVEAKALLNNTDEAADILLHTIHAALTTPSVTLTPTGFLEVLSEYFRMPSTRTN